MKTQDFDYELPLELIAQTPIEPRDESRLLVYHRDTRRVEHRMFRNIREYLTPKDVLVVNDTRVLPARLLGRRQQSGGKMEILLLKRVEGDDWEVLVKPVKKAAPGEVIVFDGGSMTATVRRRMDEGRCIVHLDYDGIFEEVLDQVGVMPLPPYIHASLEDRERYQTVYARINGSAAAPTAGLHFTPELLAAIREDGVDIVPVLLHVGLGTFRPVKEEDILDHKMHSEYYEVSEEAAERINRRRAAGGRIICVGTTSARTLETVTDEAGVVHAATGNTDIFIYPGYPYKAVDALITNFHLPQSTLLMMISALSSREEMLDVYRQAVEQRYRFFSFGDAMMIL